MGREKGARMVKAVKIVMIVKMVRGMLRTTRVVGSVRVMLMDTKGLF